MKENGQVKKKMEQENLNQSNMELMKEIGKMIWYKYN